VIDYKISYWYLFFRSLLCYLIQFKLECNWANNSFYQKSQRERSTCKT